jgi:tetratricopeptide (TPR) repeat protein
MNITVKEIFDTIERIKYSWDKRWGFFTSILFFILIYYQFLFKLLQPFFQKNSWIANCVLPGAVILIIFIIWLFSTNRLFIKNNKSFVLCIILNIDEGEAEYKIKKIVKSCTKEINTEFNKIRIKVLPINYKTNTIQVEEFLKSFRLSVDAILFATVESGNVKTEKGVDDKIVINKFSFIGKFNVNENRQIFNSTINLAKDLAIRFLNKDWAYIADNSLNDKKKLKLNFRDTILHYAGIYLIYLGDFKLSLEILKTLFNNKQSIISTQTEGKLIIPKENLPACRLNNIILNLFFLTAYKTYSETNNYSTAYDILKDCERLFNEHPYSYDHYIFLARCAYETGKLDEAISYTNKAKSKKGETIEILVNLAFFAIIDKNIHDLATIYRKIKIIKVPYDFNYADVIEFLDRQKEKLKEQNELIDFSIGSLNKLHLDKKYGENLLRDFISKNDQKEEYRPLIQLAKEFITLKTKLITNSNTNFTPPTHKKNRKKRKKR